MKTLWHSKEHDSATSKVDRNWFFEFTAREDRAWDEHLILYDICSNLAQAKALCKTGLVSELEYADLHRELLSLWDEHQKHHPLICEEDEDVHSAIERRLTEKLGDTGKKIHTGRSRNDQVLNDLRLFQRHTITLIMDQAVRIVDHLFRLAREYEHVFFPGYTHTQPAMPTSMDAWCAGYIDLLLGDIEALELAYQAQRWCPLGSAAGYGVPMLPMDRTFLAASLGFEGPQIAVTACQLGRGSVDLRTLHAYGYLAASLNRLASDVILFCSPAYGWFHLSEDQTSGSSMMPQKRNPDVFELIRAHAHSFLGYSANLQSLTSNLSSGYHRDLQLVKKVVIQASQELTSILEATANALTGLAVHKEIGYKKMDPSLFATQTANQKVKEGLSFREAYHEIAANLNQLQTPTVEAIISSYTHLGSIVQSTAKAYDYRRNGFHQAIEVKKQSWDQMMQRLMRFEDR
jgi:argininosuccinate lyase